VKSAISVAVSISASLMLLVTTSLATGPARAYEPEKDYWFVESFSVSWVDLPGGVSVSASGPATDPRSWLVVKNQTDNLLYIMSLNYKDVLVMPTPDADWKTRVNLAHEAAAYLVLPERPAALTIEALIDLDAHLVDQNVLTFEPPPEGTAIPAAQESELLMVYDQQVIEVPFTLTYTLNTSFDNDSVAIPTGKSNVQVTDPSQTRATQAVIRETARSRDNTIVLSLAAAVLLLAGGWVTWRAIHRGR